MTYLVPLAGGIRFKADKDEARIIVSGNDTGGRYSLLEWTVAAAPVTEYATDRDYGPHLHRCCEETFHIQEGTLEFLIGEEVVTLKTGDFVRVPPGIKHGYQNVSNEAVKMLVTFTPGGFEELFLKYRSDQDGVQGAGFIADATRVYASKFGLPNP